MELKPLDKLPAGCAGRVEKIADHPIKPRLEGLGVTVGAELKALFSTPSGDPTAYSVRGSVVAIRASDAHNVLVRRLD